MKNKKSFSVKFLIPHSSFLILIFILLMSCTRNTGNNKPNTAAEQPTAKPMAILQTGEQPLWFQLTEKGPILLESIEDAVYSAALVPWPLALHISFCLEKEGGIFMAINRDGFMKIVPDSGIVAKSNNDGLALYRFPGGEYWRQYTIGGFVFFDNKPAALLYLDDRFLDTASPPPSPRAWTFDMESNTPFALKIPAFDFFPAKDGWDADTLHLGPDGMFYYRVRKRSGARPEVRMLRTSSLAKAGKDISLDIFYNSMPREYKISEQFSPHLLNALPSLPEGFVYTRAAFVGDSFFVCWEEQEEFYIGAAGFVVVKQ